MPLVLIPTDDMMIIPGIAGEYSRQGFEVVVGTRNFFLGSHSADLVHIQWPEEFSDWRLPSEKKMEEIRGAVDRWADKCPIVVSVNNFYPHGFDHHPVMKELYEIFYRQASAILHYSQISKQMVLEEFPSARGKNHLVANYFCYDRLLGQRPDRKKHRRDLGFADGEFVVLIFGALRFWQEISLIRNGYDQARVPRKRLLMAGRYVEPSGRFKRRWRQASLRLWLKKHRAITPNGPVPDEDVHRYLEAADAIIVPRLTDMTSGLIGLGLTFGLPIIAPNHGAYPEYLTGTDNPIYESGDPRSLAKAIEKAASLDPHTIRNQNRRLADLWNWGSIISAALTELKPPLCSRSQLAHSQIGG